ncbi:MAG: citrate/2-methylcitrate synthase [Syntrophobacter sp.]
MGNLDDKRLPYNYRTREYGTVAPDTKRAPFRWASEVAYKNVHRIVTRGYDTTELMEAGYGLVDVLFIDFQSRIPTIEENKMLNYIMILSLDDGISPPAMITRIVASTKTILTQAAGASVVAFGHAFGAYSAFGNMLESYLLKVDRDGFTLAEAAELLVADNLRNEALGVSSLMLKDPAAKRIFARAEKLGIAGRYIKFTKEVVKAAREASADPIDLDMLGATGAVMMDLGFSPEAAWAIIAVTRALGVGAHYIEEAETAEQCIRLGQILTPEEFYDGVPERPVPPLSARPTEGGQTKTLADWKKAFEERKKLRGSGFAIVEPIADPRKLLEQKKRAGIAHGASATPK